MKTHFLILMFAFISFEIFAQKNKKNDTAISVDDTLSKYRPKYDYGRENYLGDVTVISPPKKTEAADNDYAYNFDITDKLNTQSTPTRIIRGSRLQKQGFRIQIYLGEDRKEATETRQRCFGSLSEYHPYLSFTRPIYKVRLGDFEDRKSAKKTLSRVKRYFPKAKIIADMVWKTNLETNNKREIKKDK